MALSTSKCNHLTPLPFKGLKNCLLTHLYSTLCVSHQVRRTLAASGPEDVAIDSNIYRRKQTSAMSRVQQVFRRRSLKSGTDAVDAREMSADAKRVSAPVFGTSSEVFLVFKPYTLTHSLFS